MSISWLGFLTRLIPFVDSLDDLVECVAIIIDPASTMRQRGAATQKLIDLFIPILEAVVVHEVVDESEAITAMRLGDGSRIGRLKEFFNSPLGQMLFQLLLGQILPKPMSNVELAS